MTLIRTLAAITRNGPPNRRLRSLILVSRHMVTHHNSRNMALTLATNNLDLNSRSNHHRTVMLSPSNPSNLNKVCRIVHLYLHSFIFLIFSMHSDVATAATAAFATTAATLWRACTTSVIR